MMYRRVSWKQFDALCTGWNLRETPWKCSPLYNVGNVLSERHLQFLLPPFDIRDFHDALFEITGQDLVE